jgi:hypothetical protein
MYADEHNGPTPSILEIKGHFGLAYSTVYAHVMKLIAERRLEASWWCRGRSGRHRLFFSIFT